MKSKTNKLLLEMNRPGGRGSTQHTVSGQQWQGTTFQESTHEIKGLESSCDRPMAFQSFYRSAWGPM